MLNPRLKKFYEKVVCEDFVVLYNFKNIAKLPKFERAIVSSTSSSFGKSKISSAQCFCAWRLCTTQKSVTARARKSIAFFDIRKDTLLGLKVTLRKNNLFVFLDKILIFALPKLLVKKSVKKLSSDFENEILTVTSKSSLSFPETSSLQLFFDCLAGFSFSLFCGRIGSSYFPFLENNLEKPNKNFFGKQMILEKVSSLQLKELPYPFLKEHSALKQEIDNSPSPLGITKDDHGIVSTYHNSLISKRLHIYNLHREKQMKNQLFSAFCLPTSV